MPDPAGTKTDGSMKFGSQVLTIADSASVDQNYVAEAFELTANSSWLESHNEYGVPNKQVGKRGIRTGTATLQFPTDSTKAPKQFAVFNATDASGAAQALIVAEVGEKYGQDDEAKITITVRERLNA